MNPAVFPVPGDWLFAAHGLLLALGAVAAWQAPWSRLTDNALSHLFLATCLSLVLVWGLRPPAVGGFEFHLLGATLVTLMFGPHLALVAVAVATGGLLAVGRIAPDAYSANVLLLGALPIGVSTLVLRAAERWLPPNFFIYVFGPGFLGAAAAMAVRNAVLVGLIAAFGPPQTAHMAWEVLPYGLLLSFAEATLTGMLITLMVVYRPRWVGTFDDRRYLSAR